MTVPKESWKKEEVERMRGNIFNLFYTKRDLVITTVLRYSMEYLRHDFRFQQISAPLPSSLLQKTSHVYPFHESLNYLSSICFPILTFIIYKYKWYFINYFLVACCIYILCSMSFFILSFQFHYTHDFYQL